MNGTYNARQRYRSRKSKGLSELAKDDPEVAVPTCLIPDRQKESQKSEQYRHHKSNHEPPFSSETNFSFFYS